MTIGVASTDREHLAGDRVAVRSRRGTVRPVLDDLTASLGGDGEGPVVSENRWDGARGSSVADCAMGPGSTRPVPFAGGTPRLPGRPP